MIRILRFIILVSFILALASQLLLSQEGSLCRNASTPIWYDTYLADAPNPYSCLVLRVIPKGASTHIDVACGRGLQSAFALESSPNWQSDDGGLAWRKALPEIPAQFPHVLFQPVSGKDTQYRYIEDTGLYLRSDDGGKTWFLPEYKIEGLPRERFIESVGGGQFRAKDYAVQFGIAAADPDDPMKLYSGIALVPWGVMLRLSTTLDPKSPQVYSLPGLYVSQDGGDTWKKSVDGPLINSPLGLSKTSPKIFFAMGADGAIKSEDGGKKWELVGQAAELKRKPLLKIYRDTKMKEKSIDQEFCVSQFAVDPKNPDVVFIVSNKGFYRSLDGGRTWCLLNLGFDELDAATNLVFNPTKPEEIFVGTTHGVFHSADQGEHFEQVFPTAEIKTGV